MMIVRPAKPGDLGTLEKMAKKVKASLTTLPADRGMLKRKIKESAQAFSDARKKPGDDHYLFVLENSKNGRIVGTSGIIAAVGMKEAFYSYKLGTDVHASRELDVYNKVSTLYLSNDYTGCTELCTLFLDPAFRKDNNGKLLSKCRFLFMADFAGRFAPKVIAELRGCSDKKGRSPFWEGLGRHFFSMDFSQADFLTGIGNKSFIAELMPKHPVYVNLLSKKTRNAIGKVHESTKPALKILEREGFSFQGYVDIFDAGPTIEAQLSNIRSVHYSRILPVAIGKMGTTGRLCLVSNRKMKDFRCTLAVLPEPEYNEVRVNKGFAKLLKIKNRDTIRVVPIV